ASCRLSTVDRRLAHSFCTKYFQSNRQLNFEKNHRLLNSFYQEKLTEAGCDEAGRGCYAGPVFAAAVILPKDFQHPLLNDSKQLTAEEREELRPLIEAQAISYAVASVSNKVIDRINILR